MEIRRPEVEHVTRGRSPSVTCSTEGRHISMSHEHLTFLRCIVLLYFAIRLESRKSANKRIYLSIYLSNYRVSYVLSSDQLQES